MTKIDAAIYEKFNQEGLTAGEKANLWMSSFPSAIVDTFMKKTLLLYNEYKENDYFPKNPFFPEILNHLYSTDQELAHLFIKEFFPNNIYQAFLRSEKITSLH
ncbi:MAG: hypothetical protein ACI35R_18010 [Bacillus sp. (in: firmicutes)]